MEIFGADLPAFELQQHAGLFVRIDEFGGVHTADLFEFADGRFDAVIDQYAAQVEYDGSYLFHLDYSLLPDKDRKFRNNSYI